MLPSLFQWLADNIDRQIGMFVFVLAISFVGDYYQVQYVWQLEREADRAIDAIAERHQKALIMALQDVRGELRKTREKASLALAELKAQQALGDEVVRRIDAEMRRIDNENDKHRGQIEQRTLRLEAAVFTTRYPSSHHHSGE